MRRIDYVLSWSTKKEEKKREKGQETDSKKKKYRETFEKNLQIEGFTTGIRHQGKTSHRCQQLEKIAYRVFHCFIEHSGNIK